MEVKSFFLDCSLIRLQYWDGEVLETWVLRSRQKTATDLSGMYAERH